MWVLDAMDDIESDLSVFHRVGSPLDLDGPRFFRLAERLWHYRGAVYMRVMEQVNAAPTVYARPERRSTAPAAVSGVAVRPGAQEVELASLGLVAPGLVEFVKVGD